MAIFQKGLTHGFGLKMAIFRTFFLQAIQARKMSFMIFQNLKSPFQAIKTRSSKSQKMGIFPKGLTLGFGLKMAIFLNYFKAIQARKMSFTIFQNEKNAFLGYRNKNFKKLKIDIFQTGANPSFLSKNGHFSTFYFFVQFNPGKCLLRYSKTIKTPF